MLTLGVALVLVVPNRGNMCLLSSCLAHRERCFLQGDGPDAGKWCHGTNYPCAEDPRWQSPPITHRIHPAFGANPAELHWLSGDFGRAAPRTAEQQERWIYPPFGDFPGTVPGSLVFFPSESEQPGHIGIVVRDGAAVVAEPPEPAS
jgi:hypothetical protein